MSNTNMYCLELTTARKVSSSIQIVSKASSRLARRYTFSEINCKKCVSYIKGRYKEWTNGVPVLCKQELSGVEIHEKRRLHTVREAASEEEMWAAAWLRAQSFPQEAGHAFYAKRRYAEKEFKHLKERKRASGAALCSHIGTFVCLVAVDSRLQDAAAPMVESVVGTLDVSVHSQKLKINEALANTVALPYIPRYYRVKYEAARLPPCAYITSVCVAASARRQGIASSLVQAALLLALHRWDLRTSFLHVDISNAAARHLYTKEGFHLVQEEFPSLLLLSTSLP